MAEGLGDGVLWPKLCPSECPSRRAASRRSPSLTILYRLKTLRVLWPVSFIATRSGTPARTTLRTARAATGIDHVHVAHRPRLLSNNGPCYLSQQLATSLDTHGLPHTRSAPYQPMTQGKIERYHRSLKNVVKLEHYYTPWEVERAVARFVEDYNHRRYHEALQNVTPADAFFGRQATILARRQRIK